MTPVRFLARAMLSSVFVISGARNFARPERLAATAKPITDRVAPVLERVSPHIPTDTLTLVRANAAIHVGAGLMLATGRFARPAALVLAGTMVPVTLAGHAFWRYDEPAQRQANQIHFLKNIGLVGGLLLAAADTQGKPGLRWRAGHRIGHSRRSVSRAVRTVRRDARIAALSAAAARRLPG